jgi:hypothetical protein
MDAGERLYNSKYFIFIWQKGFSFYAHIYSCGNKYSHKTGLQVKGKKNKSLNMSPNVPGKGLIYSEPLGTLPKAFGFYPT